MNVEEPSTPSQPSRASSIASENTKPGQSVTTPPASTVQGVYATPPSTTQSRTNDQQQAPTSHSMHHIITIEHGDDLHSKAAIHEKMLCEHSLKLQRFSTRAERQRECYNNCDILLDRLGSITMVNLTPELYEERKLGAKLIPMIVNLDKSCPLQEYQTTMSTVIKQAVDLQFTNKNLVQSTDKPKGLKAFQDLSLNTRLNLLNSEGALEVAEEVCAQLQRFRATEVQKAKNNVNKAWAQGRLLLRGANEQSVASFVEWVYRKTLVYEDAEHLYDLWALAARLEIVILAEECMDRLYQTASNSIYTALSNGQSLRHLLGLSKEHAAPDSNTLSDDVVTAVFRHVLKDENPPAKLSQLVIHAMAKAMDSETWAQLQHTVNQNIARELIAVMVAYREFPSEEGIDDATYAKLESHATGGNTQTAMTAAHRASTPTG